MFIISEAIVAMWFAPVVVFIILPLSMFCIWTCFQLVRKAVEQTRNVQESVRKTQRNAYGSGLQSESA